ncbi:MAG: PKD domain-containing protein [Thermoplasmatota archaeon]
MRSLYRTLLISTALASLFLLAYPFSTADAQGAALLVLDFEEDDGGLEHGGTGDRWAWGIPGPGPSGNPGPSGADSGYLAWGCPLNGTYINGTMAYLEFPELDTSSYLSLSLEFTYWMDLYYMEDELNEAGAVLGADRCALQISVDGREWEDVAEYKGGRTPSWTRGSLVISDKLGDTLVIRFLLVDEPDGYTDNGFMVDSVEISAEEKPEVSLSLGPDLYIPPVVARGEAARITFQVLDDGLTVPEDTYVTVYIESLGENPEFFQRSLITRGTTGYREVEWYPSVSGSFRGWINLTVGGEYKEGRSFNMRSFVPIYYDDSSEGTSHLTVQDGQGDAEWTTLDPVQKGYSMSGGRVIWYGSPNGGPNGSIGFTGPTWAYIETEWIDLTYYTDSFLYVYHSYSFLGPAGSSGGVVEAYGEDGKWHVLDPIGFSYGKLKDNISSPMGGIEAIVGSEDWGVDGFELAPFTGGSTRLRVSVVADPSGYGRGWYIDDMMVVGEGYDPFDTEPPAPIQGMTVEVVDEGAVAVYWNPSFARDFDHYNVYVERFEFDDVLGLNPLLELDTVEQDSVIVQDLDPLLQYWVGITAVDIVGNENTEVQTVSFKPSEVDENRPPMADIKIDGGGYARSVGDDIVFDGSGSRDPDGDPLTYFWTMPDGSTFRGSSVTWKADRKGDDLEVVLIVKDSHGLSDTETATIDVVSDDVQIYDRGDIWPFLVIAIPIVILIIVFVVIVSLLRSGAKKRLERRLERIGLDPEGFLQSRGKGRDHGPSHSTRDAHAGPKVHDLVPVKVEKKAEKEHVELLQEWKEPHKRQREAKEPPAGKPEVRTVKVVIECPFCSELFKEKVEMNALKEHQVMTVKCPHCGRAGDITP